MTDGIVDLYKAGIVTGAAKQAQPGKMVCSFGLGSAAPHHAQRPGRGYQQHHADGPAGPSGERIRRASPHQRHGRPVAARAWAYAPKGGKSFVVTTARSDMRYVVTEFGMVNLKGKSVPDLSGVILELEASESLGGFVQHR